jgi:Spy/CpxP family protein refolding chaperone
MAMKLKTTILFFVFIFVFQISPAFSQPPETRSSPETGMTKPREELQCLRASDLDLSQGQMKGLELIQQAYFEEIRLLRIQLFSKRLELRESLTNPNPRMESIRRKYWEINELQSRLDLKTIEYLIKLKNLLTHEQLRSWCPEKEFPFLQEMMQGPGPMSPMHPRKHRSEE